MDSMKTAQKNITITRQTLNQSNDWDATFKVEVDGEMVEGDIRACEIYFGDADYVTYSAYEVALLVAHKQLPKGTEQFNVTMVTDQDVAQPVTFETYNYNGRTFSLVGIS